MSTALDRLKQDPRFAAVVFFLAAATFAKTPVVAGITAGDLAFIAACALSARWIMRNSRISRTRWNGIAVLLVVWAIVGGVLTPILSPLEFSDFEFARSLLRLSVLVAGALLLVTLVQGTSPHWIGRIVLFALTINAVVAIGFYIAAWLSPGFGADVGWLDRVTLSLPASGGTEAFERLRARGVFNEPAHLGLFQILGIGYLAFVSRDLLGRFDWRKILVLISVVLTMSLGTYALLIAVGIGLFVQRLRSSEPGTDLQIKLIIVTVAVIGIVVLVLIQLGVNDVVVDRLARTTTAQDRSAAARLVGSWDVAYAIASRSPLFGSGLGNLGVAAAGFGYTFETSGLVLRAVPSWNIFAVTLGTMGIGGLLLYSLLVLDLVRRNVAAGITIGLAGFVTGGFLVATVWVFFALYAAHYRPLGPAELEPGISGATAPETDSFRFAE